MTKDILETLEQRCADSESTLLNSNPTIASLYFRLSNLSFATRQFLDVVKSISDSDSSYANHPTQLGAYMDVGTVIAFGYFTDTELSVFILLDKEHRIPSQQNYELRVWDFMKNEVNNVQRFANLVVATDVWQNEFGMDI